MHHNKLSYIGLQSSTQPAQNTRPSSSVFSTSNPESTSPEVPRHQQPIPPISTAQFAPPLHAGSLQRPSPTQTSFGFGTLGQSNKTERNYIASEPVSFRAHSQSESAGQAEQSDPMAVQTLSNRQPFSSMPHSYHGMALSSPAPMAPSPHDYQPRGSYYGPNYNMTQSIYSYPSYNIPQQPSQYAPHASLPPAYPATTTAGTGMMMQQQQQIPPLPFTAQPQSALVSAGPMPMSLPSAVDPIQRFKPETSPVDSKQGSLGGMSSSQYQSRQLGAEPIVKAENTTAAAPGPIPATTPLVVKQDQTGVQWIAFEYSRDRIKQEYTIRCDVEAIDTDRLTHEFKLGNCVYPRAYVNKENYKGNRLNYETECNAVGWALAKLNPVLQEKRGLIQRAVDSWRNSNQDPKMRSRRVRRQNKINTRRDRQNSLSNSGPIPLVQQQQQQQSSPVQSFRQHPSMPAGPQANLTHLGLATGQLQSPQGMVSAPHSMAGMHYTM